MHAVGKPPVSASTVDDLYVVAVPSVSDGYGLRRLAESSVPDDNRMCRLAKSSLPDHVQLCRVGESSMRIHHLHGKA